MAKDGKAAARGKQERLVSAAVELAHRQGYRKTTLADLAEAAQVPLGNVYYYFKTKDDIGEAIVQHRESEFEAMRAHLDGLPTPKARLVAFVDMTMRNAATVAKHGCPMGSLCAELLKDGGQLAERSNALFAKPMDWMERQFSALGYADAAADLTLQLQSSLQGASLMTQSFRDPALLEREGRRLKSWIEAL
ncbi:TetR/AcrR family transcriptional regulator [Devosia nitrariae]|uniref:TetR family transcriptional regulator n=1 Tax=Devosia nitrariae TaxID=2071872 RepID=A0ABQ5VYY8_9HYPH|nr:TetR/AcrR family transcriptional regulator [Devosia nitrariae]GLQ52845.1 TetR family transcriptional regulator [Devosia nitrariae]